MLNLKQQSMVLIASVTFAACQPQSSESLQEDIASLKQELSQLKKELSRIGSQVTDIHTIAMSSQKPQFKTLPTQANYNSNNNLPFLGANDAPIAMIEFSDYQCPYCKRFIDKTFSQIKSRYIDTDKVHYVTRDFPLGFHPKAKSAAIAANCSLQQDAYWQMRTSLFANMKLLSSELYLKSAQELSLDMNKFNDCLNDQAIAVKIQQDIAYGSSLGIRGTPSFVIGRVENGQLINPKLVVGAQSYETFALLIDSLLNQTSTED